MSERINFDGALKEFFERRRPSLLMDLTGGVPVKQSLNVELPRVHDRKADLVLLLADESLLHVEFQSTNRADMALRMAEYYLLLLRRHRRPIRQVVLYVGQPRMRMRSRLEHGPMRFSFTLRDIRSWPADRLLASNDVADQVLAILAGAADGRDLIRKILRRLGRLPPSQRNTALSYVATLSGLRRFETILVQEAKDMSVIIDWKKNIILRGIYDDGVKDGREEGRDEGLAEGLRMALRTTLSSAFGKVPRWVDQRVNEASSRQLTAWLAKVPAADRIEDVIRPR